MYDSRIYVFYDLILLTLEYGKKLNSKEKKMLINQDKIMTKKQSQIFLYPDAQTEVEPCHHISFQ